MFGKKIKDVFNTSGGASPDVRREWRYRTHKPAAEILDAAGARGATAKDVADFIEMFSMTAARQKYERRDCDLHEDHIYVATRDFTLTPLHGAAAVTIIIPKGVKVAVGAGGIGHSNVYDMNDATLQGYHKLDIYKNVGQLLAARGCKLRDYEPPPPLPPDAPEVLTQKAVAHAQNGLPQDVTVRRISLKPKAS